MGVLVAKSVQRLLGDEAVSGASLLQHRDQRAKTALVVGLVLGVAAALVIDGGSLATGALIGLCGGFAQMPFVDYWVLARIGDDVALCRSSPWFGSAIEITHRDVVLEREKETWLADSYRSPVGQLTASRFRRGEIDRILRAQPEAATS